MTSYLPAFSIAACFVVSATMANQAYAQAAERTTFLLEMVAAGYTSDHPEGGPVGLGFGIGLDRRLNPSWGVRATVSRLNSWQSADDIALCHPQPDWSCLPDSVFPGTLWTGEALSLWTPAANLPIQIIAGGGVLIPRGRVVGHGASGDSKVPGVGRPFWRAGLEILLGSARHAPRLHLTRSDLFDDVMSLDGLVTLALQLRP